MNSCSYCKSEFHNKSNLSKHQKTSKYCLKIQEEQKVVEKNIFQCEFCKKIISSKQMLGYHLKICKEKNKKLENEKNELDQMKEQVKKLTNEVTQLKEKPTIINHNNTDSSIKIINNYSSLLDYNPENITESFKKHYNSIEHLLNGDQKKLADITVQHFLSGKEQPMYYVTDRSRHKFMYTDKENNEKEDSNATLLRSLVYRGVKPIIKNIYNEEFKRLRKKLSEYQRKESDEDIDSIIKVTHEELKELEDAYKQMDIIKESDDYISQLSKCLPTSIRDRIYKDNLERNSSYDSDEEFKQQLEYEARMIGDYSVLELGHFKELYQKTGETRGPSSITNNKKYLKEYIAFLKE